MNMVLEAKDLRMMLLAITGNLGEAAGLCVFCLHSPALTGAVPLATIAVLSSHGVSQ